MPCGVCNMAFKISCTGYSRSRSVKRDPPKATIQANAIRARLTSHKRNRERKVSGTLPSFAFSVTLGSAAAKGSGWTFRTLDLAGDRIMVLGKARWQKEPVTLPEPTKAALEAWLQARGTEDGPLFVNFDRAGKGGRLTGSAVYFIVRGLGTKAGLTVHPHGLRHCRP